MLGISGAWISDLTVLEPYRPIFIAAALAALTRAARDAGYPSTLAANGK